MKVENAETTYKTKRARFWSNMATKVLSGIRMHRKTGQFEVGRSNMDTNDPNNWSNVTEHLLEAAGFNKRVRRLAGA